MNLYFKEKACASDDECSQQARTGYKYCWHHYLEAEARGAYSLIRPSLHYLMAKICEEMAEEVEHPSCDEDAGNGYYSLRSIEDCRELEDGDQPDERPAYDTLAEAFLAIPDMEDASCSSYDSFCGFTHVYAGYELVALLHFNWNQSDACEEW